MEKVESPGRDFSALTFRAYNEGTALAGLLLDRAVLSDRLREGTHPQVTHKHSVVACAVQTRFVRDDSVSLAVVLEVVVASRREFWN